MIGADARILDKRFAPNRNPHDAWGMRRKEEPNGKETHEDCVVAGFRTLREVGERVEMRGRGARNGAVFGSDCGGRNGRRAGSEHDDGTGNGVSGQRATGRGNTRGELAGVYDRGRPGNCGGLNYSDHCTGWFCEREPRSERWRYAGGRILHSRFLHGRWFDEHPVLGGSSSRASDAGASAVASDARGAGGSDGEQDVRRSVDQRTDAKFAHGVGRDFERALIFEQRSDSGFASHRQALCGHTGGDGAASCRRNLKRSYDCDSDWRGVPGRSVSGGRFWSEGASLPERTEHDLRRNMRRPKFCRQPIYGVGPYDLDWELRRAPALQHNFDSKPDRSYRGNA